MESRSSATRKVAESFTFTAGKSDDSTKATVVMTGPKRRTFKALRMAWYARKMMDPRPPMLSVPALWWTGIGDR